MLPVISGTILCRILLNFRVDPDLVRPMIPVPLQLNLRHGYAIVGVCLIGLEQVRPKGLPALIGFSSENMAHRVAILYPDGDGLTDGVYVFRRDTDQLLVSALGGRLFPGVHGHADFVIEERKDGVTFAATTAKHEADVSVDVDFRPDWIPTPAFGTFDEVSEFFRRGACGFSCGSEGALEQIELRTLEWNMTPLTVRSWQAPFYQSRWPIQLDGALIMRQVAHEWHS